MSDRSEVTMVDPDDALVKRIEGDEFDDGQARIACLWEVEDVAITIATPPRAWMRFLIANLHAMGFPEGDTDYLAERFAAELDDRGQED